MASGGRVCPQGQECKTYFENPIDDMLSFDHILISFVYVFQMLTLAEWSILMFTTQDLSGDVLPLLYFGILILFGSWFMLNLLVAVIKSKFDEASANLAKDNADAAKEKEANERIALEKKMEKGVLDRILVATGKRNGSKSSRTSMCTLPDQAQYEFDECWSRVVGSLQTEEANRTQMIQLLQSLPESLRLPSTANIERFVDFLIEHNELNGVVHKVVVEVAVAERMPRANVESKDADDPTEEIGIEDVRTKDQFPQWFRDIFFCEEQGFTHSWRIIHNYLHRLVVWPWFDRFFIALILLNTAVMAADHHGINPTFAAVLETTNLVLTILFTVELLVKVVGYGPRKWARDRWNLFDAVIVFVSLIEIALAGGASFSAIRVVRVFRLFRVLRIVKILRYLSSLRSIVSVIMRSVVSLQWIVLLLGLFMFIFSVLGLQLFAGKLEDEDGETPRVNFDNFANAFIANFLLITLEDWPTVMYNTVRGTSWLSTVYFVVWIVISVFILLNLLLVIILDNFDTENYFVGELRGSIQSGKKNLDEDIREGGATIIIRLKGTTWISGTRFEKARMAILEGIHSELRGGKMWEREVKRNYRPEWVKRISDDSVLITLSPCPDYFIKENEKLFISVPAEANQHGATIRMVARLTIIATISTDPAYQSLRMKILNQGAPTAKKSPSDSNTVEASNEKKSQMKLVRRHSDLQVCAQHEQHYLREIKRIYVTPPSGALVRVSSSPNVLSGCSKHVELVEMKTNERHGNSHRSILKSILKLHQARGTKVDRQTSRERVAAAGRLHLDYIPTSPECALEGSLEEDQLEKTEALLYGNLTPDATSKRYIEHDGTFSSSVDHSENHNEPDDPSTSLLQSPKAKRVSSFKRMSVAGIFGSRKHNREPSSGGIENTATTIDYDELAPVFENRASAHDLNFPERKRVLSRHSSVGYGDGEAAVSEVGSDDIVDTVSDNDSESELHDAPRGRSCAIVGPRNPCRVFAWRLVTNKHFDRFIIILILFNSLMMALDHPRVQEDSIEGRIISGQDLILTLIFLGEMCLKIIAYGIVFGKGAYLRDPWNCLDGFIVVSSMADLLLAAADLSFLRTLRLLRALRPLRMIARNSGMKIVINSLLRSGVAIMHVGIIFFLVAFVFGILGMNLFSGKFYRCNDGSVSGKDECVGTFVQDGTTTEREWKNSPSNFDNILNSMFILFEVATLDGWLDTAFKAMDATDVDQQPQQDNQPYMILYFLLFIVLSSFIFLNLFIGVVYDHYNRLKQQYEGYANMTAEQKEWVDAQKWILRSSVKSRARMPKFWLRKPFYLIMVCPGFDHIITFFIILNVLFMASTFSGEPGWWTQTQEIANLAFTFIFVCEAIIKIGGLGLKKYFTDPWNVFDFIVVSGSLFDLIISMIGVSILPSSFISLFRILRIVGRIFRVTRMLRLVKSARSIRLIMKTLWYSFPSLINVGAVLGLLVFIFAVLGMNLFGLVEYGECLNSQSNFDYFWPALLTLFRLAGGDDFRCMMHDILEAHNSCSGDSCPPHPIIVNLYFQLFIITVTFVVVNLFVSVILENFSDMEKIAFYKVTDDDIVDFEQTWSKFDPKASMTIEENKLEEFLLELGIPLGFKPSTPRVERMRIIRHLNIPCDNKKFQYRDTLYALVARVSGPSAWIESGKMPANAISQDLERRIVKALPFLDPQKEGDVGVTLAEIHAGRLFLKKFYERKERLAREEMARRRAEMLENAKVEARKELKLDKARTASMFSVLNNGPRGTIKAPFVIERISEIPAFRGGQRRDRINEIGAESEERRAEDSFDLRESFVDSSTRANTASSLDRPSFETRCGSNESNAGFSLES